MNLKLTVSLLLLLIINESISLRKRSRVADGGIATNDQFPYVIRLLYVIEIGPLKLKSPVCTGSLLTPTWTITAAHCSKATHIAGRIIDMKDHDAYIAAIVQKYNYTKHILLKGILRHDIALYKTEPFSVQAHGAIGVEDYMELSGLRVDVIGYGYTDYDASPVSYPEKYLKFTSGVIDSRCSKRKDLLTLNVMPITCVVRACGDTSNAITGDSGGPIVIFNKIVGIISFIKLPADYKNIRNTGRIIAAATPVSIYIEWIQNVINRYSD